MNVGRSTTKKINTNYWDKITSIIVIFGNFQGVGGGMASLIPHTLDKSLSPYFF